MIKKIFIDTNIIVDLIADRRPFSKFAIEIFTRAEEKKVKLFTTSHSILTTHYLFKKYIGEKELREVLYNLMEYIQVIPIDGEILKKGLKSKYKDLEDAVQIISAYSIDKIDCIVTRNIKDFRDAEIPVYSPEELVERL
jgi:predicted nucleic acid-binding protein